MTRAVGAFQCFLPHVLLIINRAATRLALKKLHRHGLDFSPSSSSKGLSVTTGNREGCGLGRGCQPHGKPSVPPRTEPNLPNVLLEPSAPSPHPILSWRRLPVPLENQHPLLLLAEQAVSSPGRRTGECSPLRWALGVKGQSTAVGGDLCPWTHSPWCLPSGGHVPREPNQSSSAWVAPWGVLQALHPFAKSTALCKRGGAPSRPPQLLTARPCPEPPEKGEQGSSHPETHWMERSPLQHLAREKRKQKPRQDGNQSQVGAPGLPAEPCLLRPAPRGAAAPARPVPAVAAPREAARALPAACSSSPGEEQLPRVLRCLTAHSPP